MGIGLYVEGKIDGVNVEAGAKVTFNAIDQQKAAMHGGYSEIRTFEASLLVSLTDSIKAGVSYENQFLYENGHSINDSLTVGVQCNGTTVGYQGNGEGKNDVVISVGGGIYVLIGIDVNLKINVSELCRTVQEWFNK